MLIAYGIRRYILLYIIIYIYKRICKGMGFFVYHLTHPSTVSRNFSPFIYEHIDKNRRIIYNSRNSLSHKQLREIIRLIIIYNFFRKTPSIPSTLLLFKIQNTLVPAAYIAPFHLSHLTDENNPVSRSTPRSKSTVNPQTNPRLGTPFAYK